MHKYRRNTVENFGTNISLLMVSELDFLKNEIIFSIVIRVII